MTWQLAFVAAGLGLGLWPGVAWWWGLLLAISGPFTNRPVKRTLGALYGVFGWGRMVHEDDRAGAARSSFGDWVKEQEEKEGDPSAIDPPEIDPDQNPGD